MELALCITTGGTDKNINFTWVFFETVHGRSSVVSVLLGEVGRIISPFVFGQVKANLSLTTTDSRTMLALATVHLIYTLKNGSVHAKVVLIRKYLLHFQFIESIAEIELFILLSPVFHSEDIC